MNRITKTNLFRFRCTNKEKDKIYTLLNEVLELKGLSFYSHSSDILLDVIERGLQELICHHIPTEKNTHTQIYKSQRQENLYKLNELLESTIERPIRINEVINFFWSKSFGDDVHFRTNLKWLNAFLTHKDINILDLSQQGISDIYLIHKKSLFFPHFQDFIQNFFPSDCLLSISKKLAFDTQIKMHLRKKFDKKLVHIDPALKIIIATFRYKIGLINEKPMCLEPEISAIIDARSKQDYITADNILAEYYKQNHIKVK